MPIIHEHGVEPSDVAIRGDGDEDVEAKQDAVAILRKNVSLSFPHLRLPQDVHLMSSAVEENTGNVET